MSLLINAGSMTVIDDTVDPPEIVFDSNEKLFNCTDLVPGSITLPARVGYTTSDGTHFPFNTDGLHFLGAINSAADRVLGSFQVTTYGGSQGIEGIGVFNASGTYLHYQGSRRGNYGFENDQPANVAAYTFIAIGGGLYLNERVHIEAGFPGVAGVAVTVTLLSIRFDYKLFVGTLT